MRYARPCAEDQSSRKYVTRLGSYAPGLIMLLFGRICFQLLPLDNEGIIQGSFEMTIYEIQMWEVCRILFSTAKRLEACS